MKILQLTVHFSPNLGGVETHLDDLMSALVKNNYQVFVLTYRPLSVKAKWQVWTSSHNYRILRLPWLPGFFNKLSPYPFWEFLYLSIGLFIALPFTLLFFNPEVVHAHGVTSGLVGVFWGKLFGKRVVISTHSIYHFPPSGLYGSLVRWMFKTADFTLCLSNQSHQEIIDLGIDPQKVGRFTYWIDLEKFRPLNKVESKKQLSWQNQFVVLFVGRLVPEKGIPELLKAAPIFKKGISLKIAGSGPMESEVKPYYIGRIAQDDLPTHYSAADLVIVPSTHEEGFGRVILESLACGTPVIASNRGAIPEAMDETVGKLIDVTPENISSTVNYLFRNPKDLDKISDNCRKFAEKRYSYHNADEITSTYG